MHLGEFGDLTQILSKTRGSTARLRLDRFRGGSSPNDRETSKPERERDEKSLSPCNDYADAQQIGALAGLWQSAIAVSERRQCFCTASECAVTRRALALHNVRSSPKLGARGAEKPPTSLLSHLRSKVDRGGPGRSPGCFYGVKINIDWLIKNLSAIALRV